MLQWALGQRSADGSTIRKKKQHEEGAESWQGTIYYMNIETGERSEVITFSYTVNNTVNGSAVRKLQKLISEVQGL